MNTFAPTRSPVPRALLAAALAGVCASALAANGLERDEIGVAGGEIFEQLRELGAAVEPVELGGHGLLWIKGRDGKKLENSRTPA